jgi:hypothetical protein
MAEIEQAVETHLRMLVSERVNDAMRSVIQLCESKRMAESAGEAGMKAAVAVALGVISASRSCRKPTADECEKLCTQVEELVWSALAETDNG